MNDLGLKKWLSGISKIVSELSQEGVWGIGGGVREPAMFYLASLTGIICSHNG